jgi:hypothetical protein
MAQRQRVIEAGNSSLRRGDSAGWDRAGIDRKRSEKPAPREVQVVKIVRCDREVRLVLAWEIGVLGA